ncbi:putative phage abortive infection protein [Pseudomonas khorasanensis]|uniref:Phage abortive infection protein n=1 Tax=Pseudomonas khorasanensis TaxID=2745508 RepID=A0A923F9Q0_9PSED|nr:putative phage abortive infection protein [Pseudomonas khorasanensis]MBV4488138.1 putative phage abortive infection protein [Pseudomonas khorasanensis]
MLLKYFNCVVGFVSNWLFSIFVVMLVLGAYFLFFDFLTSEIPIKKLPAAVREGTFGDSFGTLNAFFSGLAFSGVLLTLFWQRKDLSETQRQIKSQQVESQFYNMLTLQHNVVQGFDLKRNGRVTMVGRDCFKTWVKQLRESYSNSGASHQTRMVIAYEAMWSRHQGDLSLYFRSLYSVFRFASESEHRESKKFGVVARSFLSDFELVVLFYNCLSERGCKFKKYVDEFAIFNNLDPRMLLDEGDVKFLNRAAYGNSDEILAIYDSFTVSSPKV